MVCQMVVPLWSDWGSINQSFFSLIQTCRLFPGGYWNAGVQLHRAGKKRWSEHTFVVGVGDCFTYRRTLIMRSSGTQNLLSLFQRDHITVLFGLFFLLHSNVVTAVLHKLKSGNRLLKRKSGFLLAEMFKSQFQVYFQPRQQGMWCNVRKMFVQQ